MGGRQGKGLVFTNRRTLRKHEGWQAPSSGVFGFQNMKPSLLLPPQKRDYCPLSRRLHFDSLAKSRFHDFYRTPPSSHLLVVFPPLRSFMGSVNFPDDFRFVLKTFQKVTTYYFVLSTTYPLFNRLNLLKIREVGHISKFATIFQLNTAPPELKFGAFRNKISRDMPLVTSFGKSCSILLDDVFSLHFVLKHLSCVRPRGVWSHFKVRFWSNLSETRVVPLCWFDISLCKFVEALRTHLENLEI